MDICIIIEYIEMKYCVHLLHIDPDFKTADYIYTLYIVHGFGKNLDFTSVKHIISMRPQKQQNGTKFSFIHNTCSEEL